MSFPSLFSLSSQPHGDRLQEQAVRAAEVHMWMKSNVGSCCLTRLCVDKQNGVSVSEAGQDLMEEILVCNAEVRALQEK